MILSAILGLSYGATFNGSCEAIRDAPFGCLEWWLSRYQTAIAIAGAILAAWLGAQPVLRQLKLSSLQTAATLQQVYTTRERLLESGFKPELDDLEQLSNELTGGYFQRDGNRRVLSEWIWDISQDVDRAERRAVRRQLKNRDGDSMAIARKGLIGTLGRLSTCMRNYNATVGADDPELGPPGEVMLAAEEAKSKAEKELPGRIEELSAAVENFRNAFMVDLQELRTKRQLYDQILAAADLPTEA
ncbi:hypothetical protein [Bradyrhizobium sp. DASA03120]|uniref:hypothetical protein n=1 Tax=Bradyrhizobium sp. SMVTL-02 TaxID=3395917 RepID=UPI003F72F123